MIRYRPRSIVSLMLVGFAVVLTPFIVAVITAIVQVDRLAQNSAAAVIEAGRATDESRVLVEQATEMQRAIGQYAVSGDRDFYTIYLDRREGFREALANLRAVNLDGLDPARLETIATAETAFFESIGGPQGSPADSLSWETAIERLRALGEQTRTVLALSDRLIAAQASEATTRAATVQRMLLILTATAVPVTIVLIVLVTILITGPMGALGQAIRRLGSRVQSGPIVVHGPHDIEELGRELDWLRCRIQSLETQKSTFLRHISHELKTPLTTLREGSELLTESLDEDMPEEAEIARLMQTSGIQLQNLIEDLLLFAKTQEITANLELESDMELSSAISETVARQSVVAEARGIEIEQSLAPVTVTGDRRKLATVVDNLITNAIKYSPENGRIIVTLTAEGRRAVIDVRDFGPGVAPDELRKIFEPFQQGSARYHSSIKGTGLGLSIAKEYVDAHEGTIEAVECSDGGHFKVTLPLAGPSQLHKD